MDQDICHLSTLSPAGGEIYSPLELSRSSDVPRRGPQSPSPILYPNYRPVAPALPGLVAGRAISYWQPEQGVAMDASLISTFCEKGIHPGHYSGKQSEMCLWLLSTWHLDEQKGGQEGDMGPPEKI